MRSDWDACPLAKLKKKPIVTKKFWAGLSISKKLDAFFNASGEIYNAAKIAPNVDTRASGGLLVLPPTPHANGVDAYRWYNLAPPISIPDALLMLWRQRKIGGNKTGFTLYQLPDEIPYGERNSTLWVFGRSLRAAGADRDHIARRVRQANHELCKPPFSAREIERQIRSHLDAPERS